MFRIKKKYQIFWKKETPSFQILQTRSYPKDHLFRTPEEKIIFPVLFFFFEKDHLSFILSKEKIIFLLKRNIIFPDNTKKIIFQRNFFGKTIISKHLEKENTVFCAVNIVKSAKGVEFVQIAVFRIIYFTDYVEKPEQF